MPVLFISYKRDDKLAVIPIVTRLKKGFYFDVWIDYDSIPGGAEWRRKIREGIEKADVVLLMLTPDACASEYVKEEIDYAKEQTKEQNHWIIPLQIKPASEADLRNLGVEHINYIDFFHDGEQAWKKLLDDLPTPTSRDRRRLDPQYKELHTSYLRSLFTRYLMDNTSYLTGLDIQRTVSLADIYTPLTIKYGFGIKVKHGEYNDWYLISRNNSENGTRNDDVELKQTDGFHPAYDQRTWQAFEGILKEIWNQVVNEAPERNLDLGDTYYPLLEGVFPEVALALTRHVVITGKPGSGKSTVIKRATMCQERSDGCVLGMIGWMCARRDHPPVYPNGMGR
jgi:hypothetical protein